MDQEEVYGGRGGVIGVMERTRRRRERCGGGVTAIGRGGKSESGEPRVMPYLSIRFLVERQEEMLND